MEKDYSIALKFVQELPTESGGTLGDIINTLLIPGRELVMLKADKVPISGVDCDDKDKERGFLDADITARGRTAQKRLPREGRDLEQWVGDDDGGPSMELELGTTHHSNDGGGEWDQFAVNEMKFGCKSTYREELYTTKLDINKISNEQRQYAERIAKEIEGEGGRGGDENTGEDEEANFSAVLNSGAYKGEYKGRQKSGDHVRAMLAGAREEERNAQALAQAPHAHVLEQKQHQQQLKQRGLQGFDEAYTRSHGKPLPNGALGDKDGEQDTSSSRGTTLLAPWTKSINALNLESTTVPRKDRKGMSTMVPKQRLAQMPPPPKTPKVEKQDKMLGSSQLNPQAKVFQPGKAGVLHLAVSPGGTTLSGSVDQKGQDMRQREPSGRQRGYEQRQQKRSFNAAKLNDPRTMHDTCNQLLEMVQTRQDDVGGEWPEAAVGRPISEIFGEPTATQEHLNQWLVGHAGPTRQPRYAPGPGMYVQPVQQSFGGYPQGPYQGQPMQGHGQDGTQPQAPMGQYPQQDQRMMHQMHSGDGGTMGMMPGGNQQPNPGMMQGGNPQHGNQHGGNPNQHHGQHPQHMGMQQPPQQNMQMMGGGMQQMPMGMHNQHRQDQQQPQQPMQMQQGGQQGFNGGGGMQGHGGQQGMHMQPMMNQQQQPPPQQQQQQQQQMGMQGNMQMQGNMGMQGNMQMQGNMGMQGMPMQQQGMYGQPVIFVNTMQPGMQGQMGMNPQMQYQQNWGMPMDQQGQMQGMGMNQMQGQMQQNGHGYNQYGGGQGWQQQGGQQ